MIEKPPTNQNEEASENSSKIINNVESINKNIEVKNNMENSNKNEVIIKSRTHILENVESSELLNVLEQELINRREFDLSGLSSKDQFELIKGRSLNIIPENDLLERLEKSKQEKNHL